VSDLAAPLPCRGSTHLDVLVGEVDLLVRLVEELAPAAGPDAVTALSRTEREGAVDATLLLDGALRTTATGGTERAGTWLDALSDAAAGGADASASTGPGADAAHAERAESVEVDQAELARLADLEREGARAGVAAHDLTAAFGRGSADAAGLGTALVALHGRITAGLVADERAGQLRRGPRVVHDASVGRVLYFPTDPSLLPDAWEALLRRAAGGRADGNGAAHQPSAVRAALLHLELLRHQPFDAANGRVARAASRLALLADGLLPSGLGGPDVPLAEDPLAYHEEVAASARRRDATSWVERIVEAQGQSLRAALDVLEVAARRTAIDRPELPGGLEATFTLGDITSLPEVDSSGARTLCSHWVIAGAARRVPGSRGLRLMRTGSRAR